MIDLSSDLTFLPRIKKLPVVNSLPNTNLNPRFNLQQTEEQGKIHWYEGKCQKKLCTPSSQQWTVRNQVLSRKCISSWECENIFYIMVLRCWELEPLRKTSTCTRNKRKKKITDTKIINQIKLKISVASLLHNITNIRLHEKVDHNKCFFFLSFLCFFLPFIYFLRGWNFKIKRMKFSKDTIRFLNVFKDSKFYYGL